MSYPDKTIMQTVVVAQNASASPAFDVDAGFVIGLDVASALEATTAQVSFLTCDTLDGTYRVVYTDSTKVALPIIAGTRVMFDDKLKLIGCSRYMKIVLETGAGVAVAQATAARTFGVIAMSSI